MASEQVKMAVPLPAEDIEKLETELLVRRRRLRETGVGSYPDPEFYDGFRAAEEHYEVKPQPTDNQVLDVLEGWQSATFGWQGDDPDGQKKARVAHDLECVRRLRALFFGK